MSNGWEYWRVTRATDDKLEWLAVTRPDSRAVVDRKKVWTLVPASSAFIANWFVTTDLWQDDGEGVWAYENIDAADARSVALEVPDPTPADMARLTRPESTLTLDQIDRHSVDKLLGKRVAGELAARARRGNST